MRRMVALLGASALAVSGVVAGPSDAAAVTGESGPIIRVGLNPGSATFGDAWPDGASVTVTADDPATKKHPDFTVSVTADDQGSFILPVGFPGLQPGWLIRATDGTNTKTHVVKDVAITNVDPATDVITGTAEADSVVDYAGGGAWYDGGPTPVSSTGQWSINLTGMLDIVPGTRVVALQIDDTGCYEPGSTCDGDFTHINAVVPLDPPVGWQYNPATGHFYEQVGPMAWADAEAYAVSVGGHLVTINDSAEENWLKATFTQPNLWFGFNDQAVEGMWVWSSGEPVTYTHWAPGEPNNGSPGGAGNEDVAVMTWVLDPVSQAWTDLPDDLSLGAIIEAADRPIGQVLDNLVADGQIPSAVANSIVKQAAGKAPLKALTAHLNGLVRAGKITQPTMDQILAALPG